ncbi:uncharacterized protein [Eucyclogobius newberryi]|uniref:uncharacterized protein n=1 Tax=Eucyclogobius newberryi TaxID=166745 RepID=UPI003B59E198
MIAMDLSFTGQQFYFEAVDGTGTFPITEQYAAQCGYTVTILYAPDLVELRASYFSCHTMNQNDDTFAFNFNLVVNQTGRLISYALNETCSLNLPWSPREVTCDVNYLEVSVQSDVVCPLAPKPNIWDTSMEMVYSSASPGWQVVFLNENGEGKPMNLTEANLNGYTLTLTENRMVLRAAYGQRHSFITMIDGVFVEVVHAILFTRQDWLVLLVDLVAACTMYDSVNNHGGYMIWETPQTLYPGFPTTNFSFGLNGELREPTVATDLGYNLNESDARVLIGIPYNAEGTYRISVVDGDLYDLYTCNFYMEQLSSNRGLETRVRAYKKLSSPLIKSSIFTENRTVPDEKMFTVYLYNVPDDAELVSVQLENQKFNGPFVNSSFYTLDIAVNQNYTYSYTLKVPFDSPFVISRFSAENEATENKLNVVFTVFVRPQNEPYSYHTTVTALTGVAFPQFNTSCSKTGITFKRHHQPSDFLWDITVGSELLTTELAAKQGYVLSNDSHMLQLDVPLFTQGYQYENVSLKGFVGTFKILVRDHKTFKIQSVIVETCLFTTTEEIVVCSKDGTMSVVVNLSKVSEAGGSPNRTTLLDKACTPEEADEKSARFAFPLNSCDSRVKVRRGLPLA